MRKVFVHQRTWKEALIFSGSDGVQRDWEQVTQWLVACKIHLYITRVFPEEIWIISKAWSAMKNT